VHIAVSEDELRDAARRGLRVKALSWAGPSRWLAGSGRPQSSNCRAGAAQGRRPQDDRKEPEPFDPAEVNRKLAAFGQTEK
jgi:hypothetical protein